jgi:DNA-binding LacI/PurR family transcriptional regulator
MKASGAPDSRRSTHTIGDIARLAGVSAPTVSRVLNGRAGVSAQTRARVEGLLRDHGYRRQEGRQQLNILELVFHALDSPWALPIIQGVEEVARGQGLAVVLTEMQGRLTPGRAWTEQVLERRPTGVIAVFSELTEKQQTQLATRNIPLVVIDPTGEPLHDTPSVGATNWSGSLVATRHLLELGHRRIAMARGPQEWPCCRARYDGYRAALDVAGIKPDSFLTPVDTLYVEGGERIGTVLLTLAEPPTAIVTTNDLQALGVYQAARRDGVRIPEDLSVVGFDDIQFAQWAGPPMTTVRQPLRDMGVTAAEMVVALAAGETLRQTRVELATTLMVRDSTGRPH